MMSQLPIWCNKTDVTRNYFIRMKSRLTNSGRKGIRAALSGRLNFEPPTLSWVVKWLVITAKRPVCSPLPAVIWVAGTFRLAIRKLFGQNCPPRIADYFTFQNDQNSPIGRDVARTQHGGARLGASPMVGNNPAAVVADAYLKGVRPADANDTNTLYEALIKDANHAGQLTAVGRAGVAYYNKLGYVPYGVQLNESAARTLE